MVTDLSTLCVAPDCPIDQAITTINRNQKGIVLVTDADGRLLGTITDGDVRRAVLARQSLDAPVSELLARKVDTAPCPPITAPLGTERGVLLQLMQQHEVRQIPLLDGEGRVAGMTILDDLLPEQVLPLQAVIMAGGVGSRLRPLTEDLPKPMLPVGDRPLMERIIEQLRRAGFRRVSVTTHYHPEKIIEHFGSGEDFGIELNYITEDSPLGTAGALALMKEPGEPFLVINGDILTQMDFRAMLDFHRKHEADLTVGVRQYGLQVPYGVVEVEGPRIRRLREKPYFSFFVNAGIYLLEPSLHRYIPNSKHFDMTDLIERLLSEGRPVVSFPIVEYWLDIGERADYDQAQRDVEDGKLEP
jgi:dTDP-glucose pyrophosphorylase/CBS domain-containing protein